LSDEPVAKLLFPSPSDFVATSLLETDAKLRSLWERFCRKVEIQPEGKKIIQLDPAHVADVSGCWLWTGARKKGTGYGVFRVGKKTPGVHVLVLEAALGRPLLPGREGAHLCPGHREGRCTFPPNQCPHRRCVNKAHLAEQLHSENVAKGERNKPVATPVLRVVAPLTKRDVIGSISDTAIVQEAREKIIDLKATEMVAEVFGEEASAVRQRFEETYGTKTPQWVLDRVAKEEQYSREHPMSPDHPFALVDGMRPKVPVRRERAPSADDAHYEDTGHHIMFDLSGTARDEHEAVHRQIREGGLDSRPRKRFRVAEELSRLLTRSDRENPWTGVFFCKMGKVESIMLVQMALSGAETFAMNPHQALEVFGLVDSLGLSETDEAVLHSGWVSEVCVDLQRRLNPPSDYTIGDASERQHEEEAPVVQASHRGGADGRV